MHMVAGRDSEDTRKKTYTGSPSSFPLMWTFHILKWFLSSSSSTSGSPFKFHFAWNIARFKLVTSGVPELN